MNDYEKQAKDFCKKHDIQIIINYWTNDFYFPKDTIPRNIYKFSIIRNKKSYSGNFGQSIANSKRGIIPRAYDILSCIPKHGPVTFADFCEGYGYGRNDINIIKMYENIDKDWKTVNNIFSDILDELREIK